MADIWTPVQPVDETAEPRWEDQHPGEGDLPASLPAGGLAGQHLAKLSDVNWDVGWMTQALATLFSAVANGIVPASGGGTANFLRADGAWSVPAGGGDVAGPASAVADNIAVFSGTTGKIIVDGGAKISDLATAAALTSGLAGKADTVHTHVESDVANLVTDLAAKAPFVHTHAEADVTNLVSDLAARQPLDSDLTAIAALAPANDTIIQRKAAAWVASTPATVKTDLALVKADVGLGSVDNTSDAAKPVSTAQQTALDAKVAGPASSVANRIATFSGTTGKIVQDSGKLTTDFASTAVFTSTADGLAPLSGGGTTNFLRADGTWAAPAGGGTGDVVGPASSVANRLASFSGTTGKLLQDSGKLTTDFANATHTHAESDVTNLVTDLAAKAPIASPVFTGTSLILNQVGAAATAQIIVRADAGQTRDIYFQTGTANRFRFGVGSQTESGSNAGSDFIWSCWADDGTTFLGNILTVTRATRLVAFVVSPTAPTPSANDNSTKVATTAYVDAADVKQEVLGVRRAINTQTGTTYTFVANDAGKVVEGNNAAAITFTVPPNSSVAYAVGTWIDITQYGAGKVSIAAGAGVTIRSPGALLGTRVQYSGLTLVKRATDEWYLFGDLG